MQSLENPDTPTAEDTEERPRMALPSEIPVIDLSRFIYRQDAAEVIAQVRDACLNSAFFLVTHHGIPEAVVEDAFDATRAFFAQPQEEMERVMKSKYHRGYLPLGTTRHPGKRRSLKDSFDLGIDLPLTDPDVQAGLPMHGANVWPDLADFRPRIEEYFSQVQSLGTDVLHLIAASLGLRHDFFSSAYEKPTTTMRLVHYPMPEAHDATVFGLGADPHTDYGLITLLAPDPAGGLEVLLPTNEWVEVPPVPGSFVINLGDLMARWTNDVYRSNLHRVVNRIGRARYSIPTFFNPSYRTLVEGVPTCVNATRPAKYAPILAGTYITQRLQANQGYATLQVVATERS